MLLTLLGRCVGEGLQRRATVAEEVFVLSLSVGPPSSPTPSFAPSLLLPSPSPLPFLVLLGWPPFLCLLIKTWSRDQAVNAGESRHSALATVLIPGTLVLCRFSGNTAWGPFGLNSLNDWTFCTGAHPTNTG